jgi:hypothetical protein
MNLQVIRKKWNERRTGMKEEPKIHISTRIDSKKKLIQNQLKSGKDRLELTRIE